MHNKATWLNNKFFPSIFSILSKAIIPLLIWKQATIETHPGSDIKKHRGR